MGPSLSRGAVAPDVIVEIDGRRARWVGNFTIADHRLYRLRVGGPSNLVDKPHACGRHSAEHLVGLGLRGAYQPL